VQPGDRRLVRHWRRVHHRRLELVLREDVRGLRRVPHRLRVRQRIQWHPDDHDCAAGRLEDVPIGKDCRDSSGCKAGSQICLLPNDLFTGGYCSSPCDPRSTTSCGQEAICLSISSDETHGLCFALCSSDDDCAARRSPDSDGLYGCSPRVSGISVPLGNRVCVPFNPEARIGDPCTTLGDCTLGGHCIREDARARLTFRKGYCSETCDPSAPVSTCGTNNLCLGTSEVDPTQGSCLGGCDPASEACRTEDGYTCQVLTSSGAAACFPP
jgi:hypothetical protein